MRCFVTGATGVVGRAVVPLLVAAGHDVRAVARDDTKAADLRAAGAEPVAVDLFDADGLRRATEGHDAVLHLATNVPAMSRASRASAWATHNRLRTETTSKLVDAARANGVARFVKESITFVYPDSGDRWIDESVVPDPSFAALEPTLDGERRALAFAERSHATGATPGVERVAVVLRFGLFYGGAGNRGTQEMLRAARLGRSTVGGPAGAYLSSIHADDAASAVVAALAVPSGTYDVVDDEPLTRGAYLEAFRTAFGVRRARPIPSFALRLGAGRAAAPLLASQRVSNRRFRAASGWSPAFPSAREGWAHEAARRAVREDVTRAR